MLTSLPTALRCKPQSGELRGYQNLRHYVYAREKVL